MSAVNLNHLGIRTDGNADRSLRDFSTRTEDGQVEVFFRDLEEHLIRQIEQAEVVVGCVAWLTSEPILRSLATRDAVSIIVQKEDFLRPDLGTRGNWSQQLRGLYDSLPRTLRRNSWEWEGTVLMDGLSWAMDDQIDPVRCVGQHNRSSSPACPRAHHKFIVFCERVPTASNRWAALEWGTEPSNPHPILERITPYAAWTGSFNFTKNATQSFENAILLRQPEIVHAYYQEYAQIAALSEPLDWQHEWVAPEWRIGS